MDGSSSSSSSPSSSSNFSRRSLDTGGRTPRWVEFWNAAVDRWLSFGFTPESHWSSEEVYWLGFDFRPENERKPAKKLWLGKKSDR
ncbi:hypothetical protein L1049_017577 [Liquidambar formosana]|uniref:Uncharacterized protein n=1 Tax=Liquidambar formosana TaxID=63359 RepID=A0AAP0X8B0_LIQFO